MTTVLKRNSGEVERTLLGVSAESRAASPPRPTSSTANINQRGNDPKRVLDEKSGVFLSTFGAQGQKFTTEIERITQQRRAVDQPEGCDLRQVDRANSEEIAALINDASAKAQASITDASAKAPTSITRTVTDLDTTARGAIERSQKAASAAVTEMMETHGMLRNDTSALFERLREANVLLQEVLSGATENLATIETMLSQRVSEFVATMNDIGERSGSTSDRFEHADEGVPDRHRRSAARITPRRTSSTSRARALAAAAEQIDVSNRRTDEVMADRREALNSVVNQIDSKVGDLDSRLKRFASLLQETFEAAEGRARDIARVMAESSTEGTKAIANQYELVRATSDEERQRTSEALNAIYEQATGETTTLFRQVSERFVEIVRQMKEMSAAMQREMETTRAELRRGILELPQETAESAAQMRRVIVEQIDALAELNRIVARPSRTRSSRRARAGRGERRRTRRGPPEHTRATPARFEGAVRHASRSRARRAASRPRRRRGEMRATPSRAAGESGRGGWLSDLLGRAGRDEPQPATDDRQTRRAMESLELPVGRYRPDDRSRRCGRAVGALQARRAELLLTRRLYPMQGQQTFEEIRKRYRADREFRQTVDRYIGEFEQLSEEVRRASADKRPRAAISPPTPARSTPCWRTPPDAWIAAHLQRGSASFQGRLGAPCRFGAVLAHHPAVLRVLHSARRALADRRRLHHRARRQNQGRGGGDGACRRCGGRARRMRALRYHETVPGVMATLEAMRGAARLDRQALQRAMPAGAARNALDCAFWDLESKRSGKPVHALAGLAVPQALITAYTISLGTPEAMAAAAGEAAARKLLKVKLGGEGDPARIHAVRAAAPQAELIVDANEAWRADTLSENLAACTAAGVTLVEQPLPAGDDAALATIVRPIAVCADESVHDRASLCASRRQI